jgi:hypothetical protein
VGKKAPEAPDMTRFADISEKLGNRAVDQQDEQLAWAKEQDTNNRALLERVLGTQLPIMEQTFANAQKDRARYEQTFQPIEDKLIKDFEGYGTDARKSFEQGRAIGDVSAAFDAQRRNAEANLASYGVDPTTLKAGALDIGMRTAQGAMQAQAATAATQRVDDMGRALRADAINIGRGMPSQAAASYGQSLAGGQAALGGALNTTGTGARTSGMGYGNQALAGVGQAANTTSQGYQNQLAGWTAQQESGIGAQLGSLAGAGIGAMSPWSFEEGGRVPEEGALPISPIPGSTDRKPILATPGEFVVDRDTVLWKGEEFFHKLKAKAAEQRQAIPMGA